MDNNSKPKFLVRADEERSPDYNLGVMDALLWSRHELYELIVHTDLKPADVRKLSGLMDSMISECQYHRLADFEEVIVPFRVEEKELDALVDGIEEIHVDK